MAESLGMGGLPKLLKKKMVIHWHLTFLRRGQVCFPRHVYRKNVEFQMTSPLESLDQCCENLFGASQGHGNERLLK